MGEVFRAPEQAQALRLIAKHGRSAFYEGEVARDMVDSLNALGGLHTMDDFAATACDYVTPMSVSYHGHELLELPPNGQGPTALLMARMLSRFKLASIDPFGAQRVHLEAEVAKIAYDARNRFIADPSFGPLAIDRMLSDATVDALVALIDPRKAIARVHETTEAVHTDTVYLTVIDADRLADSLIYSIFHPYGSGLSSNRFGITFQNRGAGMNLTEGHVNELKGRKRPMHTLIPGLLRQRGEYVLPFGVMGGQYQAAGHARFVSNLVDYGMDLQQAMDGARSFPEPATGELVLEAGYPDEVAAELTAMGHKVVRPAVGIGGSQAIRADLRTGVLAGASDPRKDGCALGS
ncbi:MAG: gamma-glutamyltransferase [Burkholderiaceae bacterium]